MSLLDRLWAHGPLSSHPSTPGTIFFLLPPHLCTQSKKRPYTTRPRWKKIISMKCSPSLCHSQNMQHSPCLLPAKNSKHIPTPMHSLHFFKLTLYLLDWSSPQQTAFLNTQCFNPSGRHRMSYVSSILWGGNLSCRTLIPRNFYVLITVTWPKSHFGLQARSYSNKATLEDCCWPQTVTHVKTVFKLAFGQTHICKASSHPNAPIPEAQQKKKIEKKEKPASYFDGICMFCEITVRTLVSYSG